MTMTAINTKTCTRCGGTGRHSYNLRDADLCYGCGGTGLMLEAPKGQPKVSATADVKTARVGDIVALSRVLYRVERVRWGWKVKNGEQVNQQLTVTRLVDDKTMYIWRRVYIEVVSDVNSYSSSGKPDGRVIVQPNQTLYRPTEDEMTADTDVRFIAAPEAERLAWFELVRGKVAESWKRTPEMIELKSLA